jgi:hypothetical protein
MTGLFFLITTTSSVKYGVIQLGKQPASVELGLAEDTEEESD